MKTTMIQRFPLFLFSLAFLVAICAWPDGVRAAQTSTQGRVIGEQIVDGIRAEATLQDTSDAMAAAGMLKNHLLRMTFTRPGSDHPVTDGMVHLIKIDPDGETTIVPTPMQKVSGHFEAAVEFAEPGLYKLRVKAMLGQATQRVYDFTYEYR